MSQEVVLVIANNLGHFSLYRRKKIERDQDPREYRYVCMLDHMVGCNKRRYVMHVLEGWSANQNERLLHERMGFIGIARTQGITVKHIPETDYV